MSAPSLTPPLPSCEVKIPGKDDAVRDHVARWSDSNVALPAAVVTPDTEADIVAALRYAQSRGLRVVVGGGGHAPFVPVTARTLYLDLRRFKAIALDEAAGTVTVGGGALTGELMAALDARGYYTNLPNSGAVGVVGAVLGTGNGAFNSLHGFMADNVERARVVVASSGAALEISPASPDADERALFAALCGAGHGLGVVVSLTLRAYPLAALRLDGGDQIWQRRAVFPGTEVRDAARTMAALLPVRGPASATLIFLRSPPGMGPQPGVPIAMLVGSHFGPAAAAEASPAARVLLAPELAAAAAMAVTEGVPVARMNDATKPFEVHGGAKALDGTFVHGVDEDTLVALFERFVAFTEGRPDLWQSYTAVAAWDTTKAEELGRSVERGANFFIPRDRGVILLDAVWSKAGGAQVEAETGAYLREMKDIVMRGEPGPLISFPNNLAFPADMGEYYPKDKLAELERVKQRWDPSGLFWSPAMGAE